MHLGGLRQIRTKLIGRKERKERGKKKKKERVEISKMKTKRIL
jgi:hypothetical protein